MHTPDFINYHTEAPESQPVAKARESPVAVWSPDTQHPRDHDMSRGPTNAVFCSGIADQQKSSLGDAVRWVGKLGREEGLAVGMSCMQSRMSSIDDNSATGQLQIARSENL